MRYSFLFIILLSLFLSGCQTASSPLKSSSESPEDVEKALRTVATGIKGKTISDEEFKKLSKQIREDKDTQDALSTVTQSMTSSKINIKYCPVDGKRFAGTVETCPDHHVELKWVDE
jgi:hypothetical protein